MLPLLDRRDAVLATAVAAVAAAVSVTGSGNASFWGDEAASVLSAQRSLPSLLMMVQHVDAVHGLYYLGLHFWIDVFGASPISVRFPSAVAVGIAAAGVLVIGALIRGRRFGVIAGVVAAVLPRLTDVGSEARSYAMTAAIASWLSVAFLLIIKTNSPRRRLWIAYALLLAVGTALFIWLSLVALSHLLLLVLVRLRMGNSRALVWPWAKAALAALAVASPVVVFALIERDQIAYLARRQSYDVSSIFVSPWFESPGVAIAGWVFVAGGVVLVIQSARSTAGWRREGLLLPLIWMVVPTVVLLAFSAVIAVYTPRYLAMSAPAVALLIATPIDALLASRRRAQAGISIAILLSLIAPVWLAQRGPYAKNNSDWAVTSGELARMATPGDAVAFDESVRPSRRTRLAQRTYPAGFAGLQDPTLQTPYWNSPTWYDEAYTIDEARALGRLDGITRIWMVEYAINGKADTAEVSSLESAGFHKTMTVKNHRSALIEFVRD